MPLLAIECFFLLFFPLAEYVPNLVDFHFPCLTMKHFFSSSNLFIRYMCGNRCARLGGPFIHYKGETVSKRPPLGTTGKLALAGKCNRARQLLDCKQRQRDCRDLLSLIGKNSSLAVPSCSGQGTPSRNERYAARIASAEKARLAWYYRRCRENCI